MKKRLLHSWGLSICLVIVIVLAGLGIARAMPKLESLAQDINGIGGQVEELKKAQTDQDYQAMQLENEEYLLREARRKLDYKKPGEKVVFVYHTGADIELSNEPQNTKSTQKVGTLEGWWQKITAR